MQEIPKEEKLNVAIVGAGNVGLHLHRKLQQLNYRSSLFGRSSSNLEFFGENHRVETLNNLPKHQVDIVFLCVSDDAIADCSKAVGDTTALVVHVSGTVDIAALTNPNKGVCYFFQSFSKTQKEVDLSKITAYLEANQPKRLSILKKLVSDLGSTVVEIKSEQRLKLHLCGVLVNNFGNQLLALSELLLKDAGLGLDHLASLYSQTFAKATDLGAKNAQTGPALRGDFSTITKHLDILSKLDEDWAEIYRLISKKIKESK